MYMCTYVHMYIDTDTYACIHMFVYVQSEDTDVYVLLCVHTYEYICT